MSLNCANHLSLILVQESLLILGHFHLSSANSSYYFFPETLSWYNSS